MLTATAKDIGRRSRRRQAALAEQLDLERLAGTRRVSALAPGAVDR